MLLEFLDLGKQPIANNFLHTLPAKNEYFFNLKAGFDEDTKLVSLIEFVDKEILFNENYVYVSSSSNTMVNHFREIAQSIQLNYSPRRILEIGSNDGVFLRNFKTEVGFGIEPCGNFANITNKLNYKTWNNFWNLETASLFSDNKFDVIYSANCMCHIPDIQEAFEAAHASLINNGLFIFEDPSLIFMLINNSYDQIYDEHAHIFSAIALIPMLENIGFYIQKIEKLSTHGGSYRYYAKKIEGPPWASVQVESVLKEERKMKLNQLQTLLNFAERVKKSKKDLLEMLHNEKEKGGKIIGYGATSKSTVVYNYCGINTSLVDYVLDTTPSKYDTFFPGVHIPVVPYNGIPSNITCAFLGAWNFEKEILSKEKNYNGTFITHVPFVRVVKI